MEVTGAYHYPILTYLQEQGVFVSVINPLVMSKYVNVAIRKSKTDVLDSIKIANYGLDYWFRFVNHTVKSLHMIDMTLITILAVCTDW